MQLERYIRISLLLSFCAALSCIDRTDRDVRTGAIASGGAKDAIKDPNEEKRIIDKSWSFMREYLVLTDNKHMVKELDPHIEGEFGPSIKYFIPSNRWNVFYTNGLCAYNIQLNSALEKGTVVLLTGAMYVPIKGGYNKAFDEAPLFTLKEFKEVVSRKSVISP